MKMKPGANQKSENLARAGLAVTESLWPERRWWQWLARRKDSQRRIDNEIMAAKEIARLWQARINAIIEEHKKSQG